MSLSRHVCLVWALFWELFGLNGRGCRLLLEFILMSECEGGIEGGLS